MVERNPSRPWTKEEDQILVQAVNLHGEQDKWKVIAALIPGRTNKACRKRWLHSLSPSVKKSAWTPEEDSQLVELYQLHGPKWSAIAREIPGRTDDACSKRFREALDPSLKKDDWTQEEDQRLLQLYVHYGGKWGQIGQELQRSGLGCRNRHRMLINRATKTYNINLHIPDLHSSPPDTSPSTDEQIHCSWTTDMGPPEEAWPYSLQDHPLDRPDYPIHTIPPQAAPFQFSSSSLSKALSAPARVQRPLPTVVEHDETSVSLAAPMDDDIPFHATNDAHFSLLLRTDTESDPELRRLFSNVFWGPDGALYTQDDGPSTSIDGPMSQVSSTEGPIPEWPLSLNNFLEPESHSGPPFHGEAAREEPFSLSTPFNHALSLSEGNTPEAFIPIPMPGPSRQSSITHSVSPPTYTRELRSGRRALPYYNRRPDRPPGSTRLSSSLPVASNSTLRPYACGRNSCWLGGADCSSACFATSRELFDHSKNHHAEESLGQTPFRCALAGCNKSWKSLNGLQYHLQVSTAHFKNAMSSSFSVKAQSAETSEVASSPSGSSTDTENDETRVYLCPRPDCFKAYRQPSGLRYHLKHGHPSDLPAQLSDVPPALGRKLPKMTRKMRRKDTSLEKNP